MMRLEALAAEVSRPWMLKYPLLDVPHVTIETNKTCNIRCRSCYSREQSIVKTKRQIAAEIDLALTKRNAGTITLLGGEPTLHPELSGIVADVKARGLRCQILTNGTRFLDPDGEALLDRLVAEGVDRILIHIDEGQAHVHGDIEAARQAVFDKLELRRVRFGLSLTIFSDTQGRIPGLLRAYSHYLFFDSVLAVLARDPDRPDPAAPQLAAEFDSFRREFGTSPSAYLPSNLDDDDVRWLVYGLFLNRKTGRARSLSPRLYGLAAGLYRFVCGRRLYAPFLGRSAWGRALGFRFIVIQTPPEFTDAGRGYRFCYACPDATIRNGRLAPLCIADRIDPLGRKAAEFDEKDKVRAAAAYRHLGECGTRYVGASGFPSKDEPAGGDAVRASSSSSHPIDSDRRRS